MKKYLSIAIMLLASLYCGPSFAREHHETKKRLTVGRVLNNPFVVCLSVCATGLYYFNTMIKAKRNVTACLICAGAEILFNLKLPCFLAEKIVFFRGYKEDDQKEYMQYGLAVAFCLFIFFLFRVSFISWFTGNLIIAPLITYKLFDHLSRTSIFVILGTLIVLSLAKIFYNVFLFLNTMLMIGVCIGIVFLGLMLKYMGTNITGKTLFRLAKKSF